MKKLLIIPLLLITLTSYSQIIIEDTVLIKFYQKNYPNLIYKCYYLAQGVGKNVFVNKYKWCLDEKIIFYITNDSCYRKK